MIAVIIGNPRHVFPERLASFWRKQGLDVAIVTRSWEGPTQLPDGTRILQSRDSEGPLICDRLRPLEGQWRHLERVVNDWERRRYRRAMGPPKLWNYSPSLADSLVNAVSIPPFVERLTPTFVFGQEVFRYGLATALCAVHPKILMPWGPDVFWSAESSSVAFAMVRRALQEVDLVVPGAQVGAELVMNRFGVSPEKVYVNSWGVERSLFRRASEEQRRAFCATHDVHPSSVIVVNIRRFIPGWGSDLAIEAFLRLAAEDPRLEFFAMGGSRTEQFAAEARTRIAAAGLERRIRILDGHVPDAQVQQLVSVADIFTSLVRVIDMGSTSVKEAAAAGATPVLSDIASNREMEARGFRGFFVDTLNAEGVTATLRRAIQAPAHLRSEIAAANWRYLEVHEDRERLLLDMLDRIASCPVRPHAGAASTDALTVIDEIVGARKHLGLVANLLRLRRGCRHPLRSAHSAWRHLRGFGDFRSERPS